MVGSKSSPFSPNFSTPNFSKLVNLGGDGLERVVHLAVFANAVDIVEGGQQRGQHVDDAVLAEALLLLLRAIAVVDELRTFALQGFEVVCGFLLGLAERGEGVCGIGLAFASLLSLSCGRSRVAPSLEGAWAAESCAEPDSAEASAPEEA